MSKKTPRNTQKHTKVENAPKSQTRDETSNDDVKINRRRTSTLAGLTPETYVPLKAKAVFLGDINVGKSSIIKRFLTGSFGEEYSSTVGIDFNTKTEIITYPSPLYEEKLKKLSDALPSKAEKLSEGFQPLNRETENKVDSSPSDQSPESELSTQDYKLSLQIWDTAGQERFRAMLPNYVRQSDAVILVFSYSCKKSFENIAVWLSEIQRKEEKLIVLVGNKTDVLEDNAGEEAEVNKEMIQSFCAEKNIHLYFDTSAKTNQGVDELFDLLFYTTCRFVVDQEEKKDDGMDLEESGTGFWDCCGLFK